MLDHYFLWTSKGDATDYELLLHEYVLINDAPPKVMTEDELNELLDHKITLPDDEY